MFWASFTTWCFQLDMWCFELNFTRFLLMFCFAKTWCVIWQTCAATCGLTTRFRNSTALSHKQIVDNFLHIAKPEVDLTLQGKIHFQQRLVRLVPLHWRKRRGLVSRPALLGSNPTVPTARRVRTQPPLPITRGGPKGHVFKTWCFWNTTFLYIYIKLLSQTVTDGVFVCNMIKKNAQ